MRLTLAGAPGSPDVDLDVPDDARLGDLRPHLAAATGRPELAGGSAVLAVGETVLDDDQLTGQVPLLAGAVLRVGAGPVDADRAALRAVWHVAVISGPDSGALMGLGGAGPGGPRPRGVGPVGEGPARKVGRAGAVVVGRAGDLVIDDAGISRRHLELTLGSSGPLARDLGSSNGTVLFRACRRPRSGRPRRGRPLGPARRFGRAVRLRPGDRLAIGASVLEIRRAGLDRAASTPVRDAGRDRRPQGPATPALATWFGPAIGSLVLAMSTGNRLLLVLALLGPGAALWPVLRARADGRRDRPDRVTRRARTGAPPAPGTTGPPSPADELLVPSPADLTSHMLQALVGVAPADGPTSWSGAGLRALVPDGCLAVVGPRRIAVAAARALVAAAMPLGVKRADDAVPPVVVRAPPDRVCDWSWCRWLEDDGVEHVTGAARPLLVVDGPRGNGQTADLARRWAGGRGATVVLVEPDRARLPPWCRTVLEVRSGTGVATLDLPDGARRTLPLRAVSARWAEAHARRVAAVRHRLRTDGVGGAPPGGSALPVRAPVPSRVALADLPGIPDPDGRAVAARWTARRDGPAVGLDACLGLGPGGEPVVLDLVRDGPHALVAGTTGAGKSELLQSLLLSLALTHSPADLAIALVDYKGGASFGACADLPHVVGQVTDLDPPLAARALSGLRAELRSRERALAAAGVSDLATLRARPAGPPGEPAAPPRLLVVVDEFRALTEDLPSFIPGLLRLAAQGRSLGIHLILATQRPAGAVGPDLRANLALRIALRVTDAADSLDVLDVPDASQIPAALPGRAILRRGAGRPEPVQVAHADGVPADRAEVVRIASRWSPRPDRTPVGSPFEQSRPGPGAARALVDAARGAVALTGIPVPEPPWLPPLPVQVSTEDLERAADVAGPTALPRVAQDRLLDGAPVPRTGLPLALADVPAEQRRAVVEWDPVSGHLLVLGAPGSGRSTTLRTAAVAALERGWHVHAVGMPDRLLADLADHPRMGTVVGPDDPRRLARLVTLLNAPHPPDHPAPGVVRLLLVDGLEAALDSLDRVARGAGAERLVDLLRTGHGSGVAAIAAAGGVVPGRVGVHFTERLILAVGDRTAEVVAGVPTELAGARRGPGRAIRLPPPGGPRERRPEVVGPPAQGRETAAELGTVLCQVAVAAAPPGRPGIRALPGDPARRLSPLPDRVGRSALAAASRTVAARVAGDTGAPGESPTARGPRDGPVIGLGDDDAAPVRLDVSRGALVVGPPGSGRSTALAVIAGALLDAGRPIAVVARDGPLRTLGNARAPDSVCGFAPDAIDRMLAGLARSAVVLVDDLDALEQQSPTAGDRLLAVVSGAAEPGCGGRGPREAPGPVLVAAAQTARAATAYRGALGALRAVRRGLILCPAEPGSGEVLGVGLDWVADPARPHAPGRGARQHGRDVTPVQVLDPDLP